MKVDELVQMEINATKRPDGLLAPAKMNEEESKGRSKYAASTGKYRKYRSVVLIDPNIC